MHFCYLTFGINYIFDLQANYQKKKTFTGLNLMFFLQ